MYLTCACPRRSTHQWRPSCLSAKEETGRYELIWIPESLEPRLPGKLSLPVAGAFPLPVIFSGSQLPSRLHLIRTAGSFDDMPAWASNTKNSGTYDKYEGGKKQQRSFNKFLMKTNGPYINHPALLLKNLTYSDMRQQGLISES